MKVFMLSLLIFVYRFAHRVFIRPIAELKRFAGTKDWSRFGNLSRSKSSGGIWFHAASVGELEALIPVIRRAAGHGESLILSIFSTSAASALKKLVLDLNSEFPKTSIHWGYSPWEGNWTEYLTRLNPKIFVSHKYEAWPDLWLSLVEFKVPLIIIGASSRGSIKTARKFCMVLKGELPKILFLPFSFGEKAKLSLLFPGFDSLVVPDPRWERVIQRMSCFQPRANELISQFSKGSKVKGIIGSAWLGDLRFLFPDLLELEGPIWIVPHKINSQSVSEMMDFLGTQGIVPQRTSQVRFPNSEFGDSKFLMVDEMGVLAEIYKIADWVYVGGGFGEGVHSTIEPAVHGLPIACGPKGAHKFFEIEELIGTGQISLLQSRADLKRLVEGLASGSVSKKDYSEHDERKTQWKSFALSHVNASEKIWDAVENLKRTC